MPFSDETLEAIFATLPAPPAIAAAPRQPIHTLYGGAHLFKATTARNLGALALKSLDTHGGGPSAFASALGIPAALAETVYQRVADKLRTEPIEDYRLDFEDGYGQRPDSEEDTHARHGALAMASAWEQGTLPPFIGIRIKPLTAALRHRSVRTLDLFLTTLLEQTAGKLPANLVVTLPKVTSPREVTALDRLLQRIHPDLQMELMIETPESIIDPAGRVALPALIDAANGRCRGVHFGAYDYTASCGVSAEHQSLSHPACDFARNVMQVALAGRGVMLSDSAFNILPIPPGDVPRAWRLHYEQIRRALRAGFYQGWDLHPAQLPARYAAVYAFFLEGLPAATSRLKNFVDRAAQATRIGQEFDDAATAQGLLNFFLRGHACGAIGEAEIQAAGLTLDQLHARSFGA
jgi:citrate lyase beta subunit